MRKIEMIVECTNTGFSAYAQKYPVATVGSNWTELNSNLVEALNLFFEGKGIVITTNDIKVTLDMPQFFNYYNVINAKGLSERIGMDKKELDLFIKGRKKPTSNQSQRILRGVQQIGKELAALSFLL